MEAVVVANLGLNTDTRVGKEHGPELEGSDAEC